ncbi:MAG: acetate--CoA ligase family protein [Chloroflexi bacterium]|nr:acetate--CoA ligase family protein [Chloroflexota bacterium]
MTESLAPFFSPTGVAIIGASQDPRKLSHGILKNMLRYGFQGGIYPVNPKADQILGLTAYPDVGVVPDPVDLAVVVLPAPLTPEILRACGERGIKAAIIISGGFKEVGGAGVALEKECLQIAQGYQMRLVGPNCVGTMDLYTGLNSTFVEGVPTRGSIGFVSQSGAVCGGVVDLIGDKGIGFSHFASLGNELDVNETDVIAYFGAHPQVKVIAAYVEAIEHGQRFIEVVSQVSQEKPVVLLKAGRTNAGAKAVSSHTGSLAGSYAAYQTAFKQAGVIEVEDLSALFDVAWALSCQPLPKDNQVVILTNSGGPAALAADTLATHGFTLAEITPEKQSQLAEKLNPSAQVANPVDMLGGAEAHDFEHCLNVLGDQPSIDVFIPMLVPQSLVDPADIARAVVENSKTIDKTILACMVGEQSISEARAILHANKIPMSTYPEVPGKVLGAMRTYRQWRQRSQTGPFVFSNLEKDRVAEILAQTEQRVLTEAESRPIMAAYGLNLVPGQIATNHDEALAIAEELGYPVALKIFSPHILHKSDLGGIALNLNSAEALKTALQRMVATITTAAPQAEISGFLVQKMAPKGMEVIVGMKRDSTFGPLMMFGLGGVYVELFKDIGFGIVPLTPSQALEMVASTKAGQLLQGYRSKVVYDLHAVVDTIGRLSQLALDHPRIAEVEVNPLLVLPEGEGTLVLDARMIFSEN